MYMNFDLNFNSACAINRVGHIKLDRTCSDSAFRPINSSSAFGCSVHLGNNLEAELLFIYELLTFDNPVILIRPSTRVNQ